MTSAEHIERADRYIESAERQAMKEFPPVGNREIVSGLAHLATAHATIALAIIAERKENGTR